MEFAVLHLFLISLVSAQYDIIRKPINVYRRWTETSLTGCADHCKEVTGRVYGRTSDRDLFSSDLKIEPLESTQKRIYAIADKPNFYDPNYGFSKESLAAIDLAGSGRETAAESIINHDIQLPSNSYQKHVYSKYPDLRDSFRSLLQSDNYQSNFPVSYLDSFLDKGKLEESNQGSLNEFDLNKFGKNEYEKFLRDSYNNPADYSALNYGKFNSDEENFGEGVKYPWHSENKKNPFNNYKFNKNAVNLDNGKYLKDLIDQSRAILTKLANTETEHIDTVEDVDSFKFRDHERPNPRKRRPNQRSKRPRRGPAVPSGKLCAGGRCGSVIRIPRYALY